MIEIVTTTKDYSDQSPRVTRKVFADNSRGMGAAVKHMKDEREWARGMGYGSGRAGSCAVQMLVDGIEVSRSVQLLAVWIS